MEKAVTVGMMEKLLEEILARAEEDGDMHTIVKEVEEHG